MSDMERPGLLTISVSLSLSHGTSQATATSVDNKAKRGARPVCQPARPICFALPACMQKQEDDASKQAATRAASSKGANRSKRKQPSVRLLACLPVFLPVDVSAHPARGLLPKRRRSCTPPTRRRRIHVVAALQDRDFVSACLRYPSSTARVGSAWQTPRSENYSPTTAAVSVIAKSAPRAERGSLGSEGRDVMLEVRELRRCGVGCMCRWVGKCRSGA
ncbi:hypothetical protein IWX90DRAFT_182916 [Phyllosticta citrichinensis]|uniref:Uncharacterized protein n=1 Tax=Phyllosticta citrichinensis TaxID=1130410 RepID=A0ABR1XW11_9PEZI